MKKTLLVLSAIATLFAFVSCKKSTGDEPKSDPAGNVETPAFDGNVDLTVLPGYDATVGGLVFAFETAKSSYDELAAFSLSDLGLTDKGSFTKIVVLADVYDENGAKVELASAWDKRLMLKVFATEADKTANKAAKEEYNCGVADQSIVFSNVTDILTIHIKDKPISKVVVTAIKFE